jgi:prepilin-type N-terminal cleavage/methylation domain-containing protein
MKSVILNRGFTLVELLVVSGIVVIMISGGLFYYRDYNRRQVVQQTAEQIRTDLERSRQRAVAGEKVSGCSSTPLDSIEFVCTSSSQYIIRDQCSGSYDILPTPAPLPTGISISCNNSGLTDVAGHPHILFYPLGDGTDIPLTTPATITVSMSTYSRRINIDQSGVTRVY